ncbi:TPA: type VI secretion system baseplate subunit TssF [Burkholderia vietnamiensis]|nr:type VI secretion system baseplate subunit TssF [Burkholderia vietnamiensis]
MPPHRSFPPSVAIFWLCEPDDWTSQQLSGRDAAISLRDIQERPVAPKATKLAVELACTNGDLAGQLTFGAMEGDLHSETLNLEGPVSMLVGPSASRKPPQDDHALRRLVAALSANSVTLTASNLTELQSLLAQIGKLGPPEAMRYISGIARLRCVRVKRLLHVDPVPMPILVPCLQITLSIHETAFAGHAIHTFAKMMEQYFLRYAGPQDGIELVISSLRGGEIYRGEPVLGPPGLVFV